MRYRKRWSMMESAVPWGSHGVIPNTISGNRLMKQTGLCMNKSVNFTVKDSMTAENAGKHIFL